MVLKIYETLQFLDRQQTESTGKNITDAVLIADVNDYSLRTHSCLGCKI